jgi:hypothetical protein
MIVKSLALLKWKYEWIIMDRIDLIKGSTWLTFVLFIIVIICQSDVYYVIFNYESLIKILCLYLYVLMILLFYGHYQTSVLLLNL